jgi:uncharacterized protein (DUF4415 family)
VSHNRRARFLDVAIATPCELFDRSQVFHAQSLCLSDALFAPNLPARLRDKPKEKGMKSKINSSHIRELSDKQISSMRRLGRPIVGDEPRKLIPIRLDAKVLGWLRQTAEKKGLPYQSLVNEILASEMRKAG